MSYHREREQDHLVLSEKATERGVASIHRQMAKLHHEAEHLASGHCLPEDWSFEERAAFLEALPGSRALRSDDAALVDFGDTVDVNVEREGRYPIRVRE